MMARKVLCVAEKPSIAKAVAGHLGGGRFQTVSPKASIFRLELINMTAECSRHNVYKELRLPIRLRSAVGELQCDNDQCFGSLDRAGI